MTQSKSPCFPFYPSDFYGDIKVRVMTGEEQAYYLLLLVNIWEYDTQYSIPNDPKILCGLMKISEEKYFEIFPKISLCLEEKNGRLISKRLKKEKEKQDNYRKQQSIKGLKSAKVRSTTVQPQFNHGSTGAPTGGVTEAQPEVNSSISKPKPISKPKKNKEIGTPECPDWMDKDTWDSFIDHRKALGKKLTPKAAILIFHKLDDFRNRGHDPIKIINQSIENGWTGIFEPKESGNGTSAPRRNFKADKPGYNANDAEVDRLATDGNRLFWEIEKKRAAGDPGKTAEGDH